jgi:beta-lactamase regulating signal transducer with metallopeptidase domain
MSILRPEWLLLASKATLALVITFAATALARRGRASLRHVMYGAMFMLLLLLPWSPPVMPPALTLHVGQAILPVQPPVEDVSETPTPTPIERPIWTPSLADVYFAGLFFMLATLAAGIVRLHRLATSGDVWLDGTRLATEVACDSGIRRAILVVLSDDVSVPMTFGFRRQSIVLPARARDWRDEELRRALRHELEHVRRDDWIVQIIARISCAVWWPHPLVWLALRRFCTEAERACDDAVVERFEATTYAEQLVILARKLLRQPRVPALAMASPTRLSERVQAILDPAQRRGPHGRMASVATIVVMAATLALSGSLRLAAAALDSPRRDAVKGGVRGGVKGGVKGGAQAAIAGALAMYDDMEKYRDEVIHAAKRADVARLKMLIDQGFDINHSFDGDGTALLIAAKRGNLDAVGFLLDQGADPNIPSPGDGNPLIAAAGAGQVDVVDTLLARGARVDEVVPDDENALITACAMGRPQVVRHLIAFGADVNLGVEVAANYDHPTEIRTPLSMARRGGHDDVVRILIEAGARR